jgi:hypothetical protein
MRTVNYNEVLQLVSELAGFTYSTLPADLALRLRGHISRRLREIWECEYWPELTRTQERHYRADWAAGTTYAAGTEVFFKGSGAAQLSYYQSLRSGMPLTISILTRVGTLAWAVTATNHGLNTGDWVTVTGVTPTGFNLTAQITRTGAAIFNYTLAADPGSNGSGTMRASPNPASSTGATCLGWWYPCQSSYSGTTWALGTAFAQGDVVYYAVDNNYYVCHTASTGNLPTDTSYFGPVIPFDKYIAYEQTGQTAIGEVRDVFNADPRVNRLFTPANWTLSTNGVQVPDGPATVWLEFRTRFKPLIGSDYSASTAYAVGDQILFNSSGSVLNFYECVTATSAGESPNTHASKWSIIEIPYLFQPYLVNGAYADFLKMDGQMDKAAAQDRMADEYLANELMKLHDQQPQYQRLSVRNAYPSSL